MDEKNAGATGRTVEGMEEAARRSYMAAVDRAFDIQKSNAELSRSFFESWLETLEEGAELNRRTLREIADLVRWQQRVLGELSRESLDACGGFVDPFSARERGSRRAEDPEG